MCENPHVDMERPAVAELMADVSAVLARRVSVLYEDLYEVILRELMLHKNTVQYRIRKASELSRPLDQNRPGVELALLASHWLGPAVLRPPADDRRDD